MKLHRKGRIRRRLDSEDADLMRPTEKTLKGSCETLISEHGSELNALKFEGERASRACELRHEMFSRVGVSILHWGTCKVLTPTSCTCDVHSRTKIYTISSWGGRIEAMAERKCTVLSMCWLKCIALRYYNPKMMNMSQRSSVMKLSFDQVNMCSPWFYINVESHSSNAYFLELKS